MDNRLERFSTNLEKTASAIILILTLAFILGLTAAAFWETSILNTEDASGENIEFYDDNVFLNIIILSLLLSSVYLFFRHCGGMRVRRMEYALLFWTFALGTAYIATTKLRAPSYSDSFLVTYGAQRAAVGDYSILSENYFHRFPFQLGYVLYSEIFFRLMALFLRSAPEGYAVLALQELNLFWLILQYHALIEITGLLFKDERIRKLLILLLFFCFPPLLTLPFLYGNVPAYSCGICAVWMMLLFIKKGKTRYGVLCALLLALAVTLKLNLLIFCAAVGGAWIVMLLKKPSLKSLLCLLFAAACVFTIPKLPQKIYEKGIGVDYGGGIPMIAWMAMGFNEGYAAPGWYNAAYTVESFEKNGRDSAETAAQAREVVAQRLREFLREPSSMFTFFSQKLRSQWNEPSYGSLWLNQVYPSYGKKGFLYDFFCGSGSRRTFGTMNQFQQFVFLGLLFGLIRLWKKKDLLRCLLPLILLGGLLYHLLFEAKSQYALPYFSLMLPIAAYGLFTVFRKVESCP